MDTTLSQAAGEGSTPDALGDVAKLPAHVVAREHTRQWANSGLPDSLATLDTPLETVWAAVQLALSGADLHTLSPARCGSAMTQRATSSSPPPNSS